jgi:hypothetical protein
MSQLVRHIAGIPTTTEQRCVRCCRPLVRIKGGGMATNEMHPYFPGQVVAVDGMIGINSANIDGLDCTPVDLCARVAAIQAPIEPTIKLVEGS